MAASWAQRWKPVPGSRRGGGQGDGFVAELIDGSGPRVFIKELREKGLSKPRRRKARERFLREATAYRTLDHPQLPKWVADNSVRWEDNEVPLWLAIDYVEGGTLDEVIELSGPMALDDAVACVRAIAAALDYCHRPPDPMLHRDIKPRNVILRAGDPTQPVLVDFGLVFNVADDDPRITGVHEDVGNRFLRLPEAWGNHTVISDVTQLAGILVYALTGVEPHVLEDENRDPPHRRVAVRDRLAALFDDDRERVRLMVFFDQAFDTVAGRRFQGADELSSRVAGLVAPIGDLDDHADLVAHFDEVAARPGPDSVALEILHGFADRAEEVAWGLANPRGLTVNRQRHLAEPGRADLALVRPATRPPPYTEFRFEMRGSTDVAVILEGDVLWTGSDRSAPGLAIAIERPLIEAFDAHYGGDPGGTSRLRLGGTKADRALGRDRFDPTRTAAPTPQRPRTDRRPRGPSLDSHPTPDSNPPTD